MAAAIIHTEKMLTNHHLKNGEHKNGKHQDGFVGHTKELEGYIWMAVSDWKDDSNIVKILEYLEKVLLSNEEVEHPVMTATTSQYCLHTFH